MDKVKAITKTRITEISAIKGFNEVVMTKDYYATMILYLLKDIKGIYFKGGTALQKIFLDYSRLSEDIDYTVTEDLEKVRSEITERLLISGLFEKATEDKDVEGFVKLVFHYTNFNEEMDKIFIDLNKRAKLILKPEKHEVIHFYDEEIPKFSVQTLAKREMFAEKLAAAIGRNRPRDHLDVYMLIKKGEKIDLAITKKKCEQSGCEFDTARMFNKAKKLHKRWDQDILPLLAEEIKFSEVMKTLAKRFNLKSDK